MYSRFPFKRKRSNPEALFQQQVVNTLRKQCFLVFAVPNGGSRHKAEVKSLVRQGTMAGVSDLIIVLPGKVYFIEMKRTDGKGRQSKEQKAFEQEVTKMGHVYAIWDNWKVVEQFINDHRKEALQSVGL